MRTIEGDFSAVYNAATDDYEVGVPKVAVTDPDDGQEKTFGETGGLFCPYREPGFQYPLLAPNAQRKVVKPETLQRRMISGEKPIYAHAMILDRGGARVERHHRMSRPDRHGTDSRGSSRVPKQSTDAALTKLPHRGIGGCPVAACHMG